MVNDDSGEKAESDWHSLSLPQVLRKLETTEFGLSEREASLRLMTHGGNEIEEVKKETWVDLLVSQFKSLPIIMLIAASLISFGLGFTVDGRKIIDAIAILVAIFLSVFFGFFQEYKAERALEALKKMVVQRSVVVRNRKETSLDSREIVPGDVIILEEGSNVPADVRLIEAVNVAVDQSTLTGESKPAGKSVASVKSKTRLSERCNVLFAGTVLVRGRCKGVVVETGMKTEFGKIVGYVTTKEEKETSLQKSMAGLSKTLGYGGIFFAILFFGIGLITGEAPDHMIVVAVALAVAVIPEGLPTVLAITLAIGVQKMAKQNAIVRKLSAVETLGAATVICTDKTGTITKNKIVAREIILPERTYSIGTGSLDHGAKKRDPLLNRAIEVMALCNNALQVASDEGEQMTGDPTEVALLGAVIACGGHERKLRLENKVIGEVPFDSERKMMSVIRSYGKGRMAFVKGAPEKLIPLSTKILLAKGEAKLSSYWRDKFMSEAHSFGDVGMRILALAYRPIEKARNYSASNTEKGLVLVGLVAMEDPLRGEVPEAVKTCRDAGIHVVMITGDSVATAKTIAHRAGILSYGQKIIEGSQLERMSDKELEGILRSVGVFARVTPNEKYRIVKAFKNLGEVIAVTGDGVNDAPAIKKSDIGVAMGIAGTDVTKEIADIILTDDNFATIVKAVEQGRAVFNNIKSFVRYQLSTNIAALSLMFFTPVLGLPLPLLPLQILWINIIVDGPPALALGTEPPGKGEMQRPPRNPKSAFLTGNLLFAIIFTGILMGAISLDVFSFYLSYNAEKAFTAVFTVFVFLQLFNAFNCRLAQESAFSRMTSNPYLFAAIFVSLLLHMTIIFYPPLQGIFKTVPLDLYDFFIILWASAPMVILEEIKKRVFPSMTVY